MGIEFWTALGSLAAFITVIIMSLQNCSSNKQINVSLQRYLSQMEAIRYSADWRAKEKAIELALFYQEQILPRIAYTEFVLREINSFRTMKDKLRRETIMRFDSVEYRELMNESPNAAYEEIRKLSLEKLLEAHRKLLCNCPAMAFPLNDPGDIRNLNEENRESLHAALLSEYSSITNELLNKLEYFCMYINSNLIDGEVIYPSIHQTFFSVVRSLYYQICLVNDGSSSDRYYTHVRDTYLDWSRKYSESRANETETDISNNRPYKQVERP